MDTKTALRRLTHRAETVFAEDEEARTLLANSLGKCAATDLATQIDATIVASANAKPWTQLMKRIEHHGVREGLAKQKAEALEHLLSYGMSMSTSLVANATRLAEQDGLRRFLNAVDTIEIDEDDAPPAEEPAGAPAPVEALAPTEVKAPKVTPAQKRTLQSIAVAGVRLRETRVAGGLSVETQPGHARPRRDMVEFVIEKGWAQCDCSTALFRGQAVALTAAGEAILAG